MVLDMNKYVDNPGCGEEGEESGGVGVGRVKHRSDFQVGGVVGPWMNRRTEVLFWSGGGGGYEMKALPWCCSLDSIALAASGDVEAGPAPTKPDGLSNTALVHLAIELRSTFGPNMDSSSRTLRLESMRTLVVKHACCVCSGMSPAFRGGQGSSCRGRKLWWAMARALPALARPWLEEDSRACSRTSSCPVSDARLQMTGCR